MVSGMRKEPFWRILNTWILGNGTPPKRKISTSHGNMGLILPSEFLYPDKHLAGGLHIMKIHLDTRYKTISVNRTVKLYGGEKYDTIICSAMPQQMDFLSLQKYYA